MYDATHKDGLVWYSSLEDVPEQTEGESVLDTEMPFPGSGETLAVLGRLHYDFMVLIFLLLVFWIYKELKFGIRSFGNRTRKGE